MSTHPSAQPREHTIHVIQGDYAIVDAPNVVLTTILGSCVATCMWDPTAAVGGMNHFLLPGEDSAGAPEELKYGINAMELLINGLLQAGALRSRIKAKLFGGAHVINNLTPVGERNAEFATRFLATEGIPCVARSMGGVQARRVRFWPTTGRAGQLLLVATQTETFAAERRPPPLADTNAGSVELF